MREWSTQMEEQATQFVQLQEKLKEREKEREEQVVKLETQDKQLQQVKVSYCVHVALQVAVCYFHLIEQVLQHLNEF